MVKNREILFSFRRFVRFDVEKIISGQAVLTHPEQKRRKQEERAPARAQSEFTKTSVIDSNKKDSAVSHYAENILPIGKISWRKRAQVQGRVNSIKSAPASSTPYVEVEVWDESGGVTLQFLGRREITGLEVGAQLRAEGMVGENNGQLIILNPSYEIVI